MKNKGDDHDVGEQRNKKDGIYEIDVFLYYYIVFIISEESEYNLL